MVPLSATKRAFLSYKNNLEEPSRVHWRKKIQIHPCMGDFVKCFIANFDSLKTAKVYKRLSFVT